MKPQIPALIFLSLGIAIAPAVEIFVSADPAGPIAVGQEVTINLAVRGWNPADPEVDAIAFNMDFDTDQLRFVTGSGALVKDGSEFLALPNQGAGYSLDNDSSETLIDYGRYIVGCADIGDGIAGSIGPSARIGSFRLRAIAPGTTKVKSSANSPTSVFSDPKFYGISPTGGVDMGGIDVVITAPSITYSSWAATIPFASQGDARPGADPDFDGRVNTLEYFLDANPLFDDPDRDPLVGVVEIAGEEFTTLSYERPAGFLERSDAKDRGQRSADLEAWSIDDVTVVDVGTIDPATSRETVLLRSTVAIGDSRADFLRLLVELEQIIALP